MTLVLSKCFKNDVRFVSKKIGDRVVSLNWKPESKYEKSLCGLKDGNGDWGNLYGDEWLIIDADDQIVDVDEDKCIFNTGVILFRGTAEELANSEFPAKFTNLNSQAAFYWAYRIGNKDLMINKIADSKYAYLWAINFCNHEIMMHKITDSEFAYAWAYNIGNCDIMINEITESEWAYHWASNIGNRDIMINRITDSEWAYYWAVSLGDQDVMMHKITESEWAYQWAVSIGNHDIMMHKITDSRDAYDWASEIGNEDIMKEKIKELYWIGMWNDKFIDNKIER